MVTGYHPAAYCLMSDVQRTILLVEDNEDDQILIQEAFRSAGIHCSITALSTAEAAIAYLMRQATQPDARQSASPAVILIDLSLPGKSGHDLLRWIQERREFQHLVRVVLSGSDNPEDVEKSYRFGAHGYLMKPLTVDQLNQPGRTLKMILLRAGALPQAA
jgi:CheY-like chemotaxis protein